MESSKGILQLEEDPRMDLNAFAVLKKVRFQRPNFSFLLTVIKQLTVDLLRDIPDLRQRERLIETQMSPLVFHPLAHILEEGFVVFF